MEGTPSDPVQPPQNDNPMDRPPPRTTQIANRFDSEPVNANTRITIKQAKRKVTAEKKEGWLFGKNSGANRSGDQHQLTVTDLEK